MKRTQLDKGEDGAAWYREYERLPSEMAIDGYAAKPDLPERREPKIHDSLSEDRLIFSSAGA